MDNRRLILLMIFGFSLVMLWDAWQKYNQPKAPATVATQAASAGTAAPQPTTNLQAPAAVPNAPVAAPVATAAAQAGETITIKTDVYTADISTVGGDITRLEFNRYTATVDKAKSFALFEPKHRYAAQSGLIGEGLPNHRTVYTVAKGPRELPKDGGKDDQLKVRLEAAGANGVKLAKTYTFSRGSYQIDVTQEIVNGSGAAIAPHTYYQFQRDDVHPEGETAMVSTFTGPAVFTQEEKYQKLAFDDIAKDKAKFAKTAENGWLAMVQHYFVAAWVPQGKDKREFYARKIEGTNGGPTLFASGLILPVEQIAAGATGKQSITLYAGPQEQATLKKLADGLDLVVDYGWLTVVAAPIFWVLQWIHALVGNWGWAIIFLTVLIKAIFYPLSAASYKSMAKMKVVAPKLNKLKETYGDDRARLNQEMMDLYKREKINPLGGCLPVLIQIPVFIALYWVLLGTVEMRYAPFIGYIQDLSAKDPYFILPIIMGVTMVVQTRLNPPPPDPIQAKVMMFMPIMFTGMFLFFPAGLVLYWIVNNILSIAQQWQINRAIEDGGKKAA